MSYEKVVLTDGTEVLFITSEDPQAPDTTPPLPSAGAFEQRITALNQLIHGHSI